MSNYSNEDFEELELENEELGKRVEDYENRIIPAWKKEEDDWIERERNYQSICKELGEALEAAIRVIKIKTMPFSKPTDCSLLEAVLAKWKECK